MFALMQTCSYSSNRSGNNTNNSGNSASNTNINNCNHQHGSQSDESKNNNSEQQGITKAALTTHTRTYMFSHGIEVCVCVCRHRRRYGSSYKLRVLFGGPLNGGSHDFGQASDAESAELSGPEPAEPAGPWSNDVGASMNFGVLFIWGSLYEGSCDLGSIFGGMGASMNLGGSCFKAC